MSATPELPSEEPSKAYKMLERVRSEAAELRNFTISFLSLLLYVAIIIASTTHEQILRIDPVKLPLLNVDIPIVGFYWFMPALLFFIHLYILLQHYLFSQLAFRFREELLKTDDKTQHQLQRSLGNLPFLHWLAGRKSGFMTFLMSAITMVSLIIWPLFTFWWLQAAFLPYHDNLIVWTQRFFLLFDAALVAYLWAKILDDRDDAGRWWRPWLMSISELIKGIVRSQGRRTGMPEQWRKPWFRLWFKRCSEWLDNNANDGTSLLKSMPPLSVTARWLLITWLIFAFGLSFFVSTLPDSWEQKLVTETFIGKVSRSLHEKQRVELTDDQVNDYDPARLRECDDDKNNDKQSKGTDQKNQAKCYLIDGWFPRNLILNERILIANKDLPPEILANLEAKKYSIDPETLSKIQGLDLRGRHLEYADFTQSSLPNADMRRARLKATDFNRANLHKVNFQQAQLQAANLTIAAMPGANLSYAKLPIAKLNGADLSGANLTDAQLPAANLYRANLTGSILYYANFVGANLTGALLIGANIPNAILIGADLSKAKLHGAYLKESQLNGAVLDKTELFFASLLGVNVLPMQPERAQHEIRKFMESLDDLPRYQNANEQAELKNLPEIIYKKITKPVDFSNVDINEGCFLTENQSILSGFEKCKPLHDPESRESIYKKWLSLACDYDTNNPWLAESMVLRAAVEGAGTLGQFASMLSAKPQTLDQCPGLAKLSYSVKDRLSSTQEEYP